MKGKKIFANIVLCVVHLILNVIVFAAFAGVTLTEGSDPSTITKYLLVPLSFVPAISAALIGGAVQGIIVSTLSLTGMSLGFHGFLISAVIVLACSIMRGKIKFRDYAIGCAFLAVMSELVGYIGATDAFEPSEFIISVLIRYAYSLVISTIYFLIDRKFSDRLIKLFPKNKHVVMHKNYRKRSIRKELLIIINVVTLICSAVLAVFSFMTFTSSDSLRKRETITHITNDILEELAVETLETEGILSDNAELIEEILIDYTISEHIQYLCVQKSEYSETLFDFEAYTDDYIDVISVEKITDEYGMITGYTVHPADESVLQSDDLVYAIFNPIFTEEETVDGRMFYEELSLGIWMYDTINNEYKIFVADIICMFLTLIIYINIFANWRINKRLAEPINDMTEAVTKFAFTDEAARVELKEKFDKLSITTGDEIEVLYMAYGKTMADMSDYINDIDRKSKQISKFQHNIIVTMADIIESRDENTGGHIKRTAAYVEIIARKLQTDGLFPDILTDNYINDMIVAAPLHDMGKIHVSDTILNKNGRLTDEEFSIMKSHTTAGKQMLENATETLGVFSYLSVAIDMANYHHEWWNGKGYPEGRSGEDIPLCARIMAVADVFDALISKRCYKNAMPLEKAYSIIREETGTHFDPVVAEAFFASKDEIEKALKEFEN